jgi:hypothetical protein
MFSNLRAKVGDFGEMLRDFFFTKSHEWINTPNDFQERPDSEGR